MSLHTFYDLDYISQCRGLSYDNVWYIKPETPPVIFEDVYGNEVTRYVERDFGSRLRNLNYCAPRIGDFSRGDPIRRESIVLDHYGGYVILNNVLSNSRLTSLSQVPLPLSSWMDMDMGMDTAAIQASTDHIRMGLIGKFLEHR